MIHLIYVYNENLDTKVFLFACVFFVYN